MANIVKNQDTRRRHFRRGYSKDVLFEGNSVRNSPPTSTGALHVTTSCLETYSGWLTYQKMQWCFAVAEMSRDPIVWEQTMEFKPERFMQTGQEEVEFDIKGLEIFRWCHLVQGVGQICPAITLSLLHIEYFVANYLVRYFEWKADDKSEVDLTEKQAFTMVMRYSLFTNISPRINWHLLFFLVG